MDLILEEGRKKVLSIEEKIAKHPLAMFGDCLPLKHSFATGIYVREIFIPKGFLLVSKIHRFDHPVFILEGDISILDGNEVKRIKAPFYMISPVGAKRVGFAHEDTRWVTVHKTNETDLEKIEEEIICKNFDELSIEEKDFIEIIKESEGA